MNEQTRYRVTGAVFLLAIAIIVLPMVFDGEGVRVKQLPELSAPLPPAPNDAELTALQIPAAELELHRDEMEVASGLLDSDGFDTTDNTKLGDPVLREVIELGEPVVEPGTAGAVVARIPESVAVAQPPPATDKPARLTRTAPPVRSAVDAASGSGQSPKTLAKRAIWAVQLASFASSVNATALRDQLLKDGFEAWTSTAKSDGSVRTRVAIGPLLGREDAERMRDLVSGRYEVSAIVVHMEP